MAPSTDALVVLGGDLNDTPGSPTLDALEASGLVSVAAELPPTEQGTFVFGDAAVALDHLYVPAALRGRYITGSARVVRDDATPRRGHGYAGSDHAALVADFAMR